MGECINAKLARDRGEKPTCQCAMCREPRDTMLRLKRWIGKERARAGRIEKAARARGDTTELSRSYGEWTVLDMVMRKIDAMLKEGTDT